MNINKENIALLKHVVHISKEDMKYYNLVMFTHAMDFFKERASLKKLFPEEEKFTSLLNNMLIEDLVTFGNLF